MTFIVSIFKLTVPLLTPSGIINLSVFRIFLRTWKVIEITRIM